MAITFVAATSAVGGASNTSLVVNKPSGVVAGDVLVGIFCVPQGQTITNPSGFTTLNTQNASTGVVIRTAYKVAGGSEPSTYTWMRSSSGNTKAATMLAFRGVDNANPIRVSNSAASANTTSHTSATLSGVQSTDMVVRMGGARPEGSSSTNAITASTTGGWTAPTGGRTGSTTGDTFPATTASAYSMTATTGGFTTNVNSGIGSGSVALIEAPPSTPDSVGVLIC